MGETARAQPEPEALAPSAEIGPRPTAFHAEATDSEAREKPDGTGTLGHLWSFAVRVLRDFVRNKGFLLAGALGYNTLLSIIPLFALLLVVLSHVFDERVLAAAIATQAEVLLPGQGGAINQVFLSFVENRGVIGGVGVVVLLFFSTIAFRMLDDAIAIVFHRRARGRAPHPLRAFVLPLAYVGLIGLGILGLTLVMVAFDALPADGIRVLGVYIDAQTAVPLVKLLAFVGLVILLASFYGVMPMAKISWKRALLGGFIAATLWEAVRLLMMWYFATISLVDVVYGSLGAVIVLLVGLEVAAIILLFGAQIIAELEHAAEHGRAWFEPPPPDPTWQ
jgi:membrane protein